MREERATRRPRFTGPDLEPQPQGVARRNAVDVARRRAKVMGSAATAARHAAAGTR
jgi:hypothetical protein